MIYDITLIGAGIIGCQLAYDLSHFNVSICLLEKNNEVLNEITSANSGIIHTGYDPEEGTLKAQLNVLGALRYPSLCAELKVPYAQVGSLVVSNDEEGTRQLDVLEARAQQRHIPVERLNQNQVRAREPHISTEVIEALYFPTTGMILPWEVGYALIDHACANGLELKRNAEVLGVLQHETHIELITPQGSILTKQVINCAGLKGEVVARLYDRNYPHVLSFRKGQYHVTDKTDESYINHILFPVPTSKGKGILAVKTTEGNLLFGPTSEAVDNPYDHSTSLEGLREIDEKLPKLIQALPKSHMIHQFAGMRPNPNTKDFIIEMKDDRWINAIGIDSPGLASSPAISNYIIDTLLKPIVSLMPKKNYVALEANADHRTENLENWNERIQKNPNYGKIVCVCEGVSEQEILNAIRRPAGAVSIKGVKRRVRPGSGRCQGGFCESRIVSILAKELNISKEAVVYEDSPFLYDVKVKS